MQLQFLDVTTEHGIEGSGTRPSNPATSGEDLFSLQPEAARSLFIIAPRVDAGFVVAHVCTTTPAAPPVVVFDGWAFPLMRSRDLPQAEFGLRQVIEAS